ncbi:MAG: PfkB family carbohydrate kinase [Bacteroidales bacterium]|nr:PfkB family carbohydrate kinase [Bacteroidales bacterium]
MNKLVIAGSLAFDAIETPFGKTDKIIGGASPYIALSASNFNVDSCIVSVVGGDFPKEYFDILSNKNINVDGVKIVKEGKTMFWAGKYNQDMNQRTTLCTELNVFAEFNPEVPQKYQDADVLMLGNITPSIQKAIIEKMSRRPKLIIMDTMNYWMDNTPNELEETISMVDVLTINDEEARQLSGEFVLLTAAEKILAKGLRYLIIKKGDNGAILFSKKGEIFFAPALPMKSVCDPTGAGDSFAGGFAGYIASKGKTDFETVKSAVIAGSVMGSFCCERFGTENLQILNKDMVTNRVKQFENLTRFNF